MIVTTRANHDIATHPPLIDGSMPNLMQCNALKPFWEELYGGTASAIWLPRKEQPSMASRA